MRHRARKTLAGTMAIEMAPPTAPVAPTPHSRDDTQAQGKEDVAAGGHIVTDAPHGAVGRTVGRVLGCERRGERPPLFERTLTGVRARRPSRAIRGRSPLRPGRVVFDRHRTLSRRVHDVSPDAGHHAIDCPAALGSVKARRFAPPAHRAASALTEPSVQPGWAFM